MTSSDDTRRRLSITKSQRQTEIAVDLIALCQHITEDGRLTPGEVVGLRDWLADHRHADLPAIAFLANTVDRVLEDGRITSEEHRELYLAIEATLPPDIRSSVRGIRREQEQLAKDAARAAREAEREAERERKWLNAPVETLDFMVAGVVYEGRGETVAAYAEVGHQVYLLREPGNGYSRNAILVVLGNGMPIGYVPEELAAESAPLLDSGHKHLAWIKKILTGGRAPYPVVVAEIYRAAAEADEAVFQYQVPPLTKAAVPAAAHFGPWQTKESRRSCPHCGHSNDTEAIACQSCRRLLVAIPGKRAGAELAAPAKIGCLLLLLVVLLGLVAAR